MRNYAMLKYIFFLILILPISQANAAKLLVGADKPFKSVGAAIKASRSGDTILVEAGTYRDDFANIKHRLTLRGVNGKARLVATKPIPNGKAFLISKADLVVENFMFKGAKVSDRNGAGIRYQGGSLIVEDCVFENNENGILGSNDPNGSIIIRRSQFLQSGYGDGYSHGIYIGRIATLNVDQSFFKGTKAGHHIKSRAETNTITNNLLDDGDEGSSYSIDLPHGGTGIIANNKFVQSASAHNKIFISFGTKSLQLSNTLSVSNNHFINYASHGTGVRNASAIPVLIRSNTFIGAIKLGEGPTKESGNIILSQVPEDAGTFEAWNDRLNNNE
jgi:copper-binding protein NosD